MEVNIATRKTWTRHHILPFKSPTFFKVPQAGYPSVAGRERTFEIFSKLFQIPLDANPPFEDEQRIATLLAPNAVKKSVQTEELEGAHTQLDASRHITGCCLCQYCMLPTNA